MNTSKRTQRPILLAIVAVLALAVLVSASVIFALATEPEQDTVYVSLDGRVNVVFNFVDPADSYTVKVGSEETQNVIPDNGSVKVALYPYQMTETIEVIKTGETAGKKISVVDYVKKILASSDTNVMKYQDSARALLNYGAMTQLAFDKDTSNLANAGIFTKGNPIDGVTSITADSFEASGINGEINLILREGDIVLRYELTSEESFTATLDDEAIEFQSLGENKYSFEIKNISVNDFAKKWTVVIDGATTDPVTCERTVLQYLNYNIFDATSTASDATKDACRALYQLYQQTVDAAKPDQETCEHDKGGYAAATVESNLTFGASVCKCNVCAKEMHINLNYDGKCDICATTDGMTDPGALKLTYEDLKNPKIDNASSTSNNTLSFTLGKDKTSTLTWLDESDNTLTLNGRSTLDIGDARYAVIKMSTTKSNTFEIRLSTTNSADVSVGYFARNEVFNSNRNVIYVVDLNGIGDAAFVNSDGLTKNTDGTRTLDTLVIHSGGTNAADQTLSIEYIAFSNDLGTEMAKLIGEDTSPIFVLECINKNTSGTGMKGHTTTKDCLLNNHNSAFKFEENKYIEYCTGCSLDLNKKDISAAPTAYLRPENLEKKTDGGQGTAILNNGYVHLASTSATIWLREPYVEKSGGKISFAGNNYNLSSENTAFASEEVTLKLDQSVKNLLDTDPENYTFKTTDPYCKTPYDKNSNPDPVGTYTKKSIDIGSGRYMVMRVRTNVTSITVKIGTDKQNDSGTGSNQAGIFVANALTTKGTETWETIVFDLNNIPNKNGTDMFVEGQNHKIDTLIVDAPGTDKYIDVAYIAFLENLDDANALKDADATPTT